MPTGRAPLKPARARREHSRFPPCVTCAVGLTLVFICGGLFFLDPYHGTRTATDLTRIGKPHSNRTYLTGEALLQQVAAHHPVNRLQCGGFVQSYAKLHKDILAGRAPQRYAVMRSRQEFMNGLADRLATAVSIFLYAVLTDRAFQWDWDAPPDGPVSEETMKWCGRPQREYEPLPPLWDALRSDFIDWRYTAPDHGNDTLLMDHVCDKGMAEYKAFFREKDLMSIGKGRHSVVWQADHAGVYASFDNPHLKKRLAELGLERETAFACLFDFLFRPTSEVVHMFEQELNVLLDPNFIKIGVQIRVGDWQLVDTYKFKPQHYPSLFHHYFQCAEEIESDLAHPGQPVAWYTLVDIPELRQHLAQKYTRRILINTDVVVEHMVKSSNASGQSMKQAVGELWAFSFTQAQVITRISGFGKLGAMIGGHGHVYTIDYPMTFFDLVALNNRKNLALYHRRSCKLKDADPLIKVCTDFTGI